MKIKWLGLASFLITSREGTRIVTDPYQTGGDLTYGEIEEMADIVTVSHDHFDHNNVASVRGGPHILTKPGRADIKGISFRGIASLHDDVGGKERGKNMIFCFDVDQIRICHLGDLGHQLRDDQTRRMGSVDVLLIPVGGVFTIDSRVATELCGKVKPRMAIPMHYRNGKCNFPIATVDEFLKNKENVSRPNSSEIEVLREALPARTQIVVLRSAL